MGDEPATQQQLEYQTPKIGEAGWVPIWRLFLLGPVTGALVGFASNAASLLVWMHYGQPDFFYRGWSGVESGFMILMVGGAALGLFYGLMLLAFEVLTHRRVQLALVNLILVTTMFVVSGIHTMHDFKAQLITWLAVPELGTALFGLLISIATAKRDTAVRLAASSVGCS